MRTSWLCAALVAGLALGGCGSDDASHGGGGRDLSIPDMTMRDLVVPSACNPTDPMTDGSPCSAPGGCPAGTIGVNLPSGECKCLTTCSMDPECSCNRFCDDLTRPDAGVVGKACVPGNPPGERCSVNMSTGLPYYNKFCGQLTTCVNSDPSLVFKYCNYKCSSGSDCPAQTTCQPLLDSMHNLIGNVCAYLSGPNGNKDLGQACAGSDVCKTGQLCAGTCLPQCDGPGATCTTGTCTEVDDTAKGMIIGYVCK